MRITPLDVRKQDFRKSVRGFDCDEVRAFLETLSHEYEAVLVDNKHLREQFMEQDEKISEYTTLERTLRDTLMTAERVMQDTRKNANKEGTLIIHDAELKARSILEECRLRTVELRREIMSLRQEKDNYLARFEGLAQAQIQFVTNHKSDFEEVDNRLLEIATSISAQNIQGKTSALNASEVALPVKTDSDGDQWRDYEPNADFDNSSEVETVVKTTNDTGKVSAASVDMAAYGIPVPAVPKEEVSTAGEYSAWPPKKESTTVDEVAVT